MIPVNDGDTVSGPATTHEGATSTVTTLLHENDVPLRVPFRVKVKLPAPPAVTVTDALVVALVIEPLPEIDQLYVTVPPVGLTVDV